MWLEIDQAFEVRQRGFIERRAASGGALYLSGGNENLRAVTALAEGEYCQAVEVDRGRRTAAFGRDYLGHHPLLYAHTRDKLFVSDEIGDVRRWLTDQGRRLTLSEEAVGLYFAMGYVPQGLTLHHEIKTCRNASLYHWNGAVLTHASTFTPVAPDGAFPLADIRERVDAGIEEIVRREKLVDVWCSGGLDSSIVAASCSARSARAELLTLTYDDALPTDGGELRFAEAVARHTGAPLRHAQLTKENYCATFHQYASTHVGPVVDYLVPLKYALAKATRALALTGEGGDPLFAGAKNNFILYLRDRHPGLSIGRIYAMAHKRLYGYLPEILKRGRALADFADAYLAEIVDAYPGDLLRKLFYVNTFEKQGGMIFPKNYYAGKRYGVDVRHPLTSLAVYRAAFSLPDDRKYVYPRGKLALIELYKERLPAAVVRRRKSGTRLPLDAYVGYLIENGANLDALKETGFFAEDKLDKLLTCAPTRRDELVLLYGLLGLSAWIGRQPDAATAALDDARYPGASDHAG